MVMNKVALVFVIMDESMRVLGWGLPCFFFGWGHPWELKRNTVGPHSLLQQNSP